MKFKITGKTKMGKATQPFEKEIEATSEHHAEELVYSFFGSKHGVARSNIRFNSVEQA